MSFAVEGFAAIAQNYIPRTIASNFYARTTFLSALGAFSLGNQNKSVLEIGRPGNNAGAIFSGKAVNPADMLQLGTVNGYQPGIQRFAVDNSKVMMARDTEPTTANPTTNSNGQAIEATAMFRWVRIDTPILIWNNDIRRAGQQPTGRGIAMADFIEKATEVGLQAHVGAWNTQVWTGNPSDQASDPWDSLIGLPYAVSATGIYGNVNRSDAANAAWRAQVDASTTTVDIVKLLDRVNIGLGLRDYGPGADLCICNSSQYPIFKQQILNSGGVVMQNGMPKMGELGVTKECLQKDNCYIMYDVSCPANTCYFFTSKCWRLAMRPGVNLSVTPFEPLNKYVEGGKDAVQAYVRTEAIFSNDNPYLSVKFTALSV